MQYWINLKKKDSYYVYEDALLNMIPENVIALLGVDFAEEIGLCEHCNLDCYCHPIDAQTGLKYCTILFQDAFKPKWKLEDVL